MMSQTCFAQTFRKLIAPEGMSISNVRAVVQDRYGFLWFATFDGLFRYDSHTIKQYRHSSSDPNSISSDLLKTLFCDSKGNLWVGGTGGLDRYNRETDNFTHINHNLSDPDPSNPERKNQIYCISEDRDHRILVGTAFGINSLVVTKNGTMITHILHRAFDGSTQIIGSVSQAASGDFWAGSLNGLISIPRLGGAPRLFRISSADKSLAINQFAVQYLDNQNVIWLGPGSGGIVQFDIATETFRPIADFVGPHGEKPIVYQIIADGKGKMWIATYSGLALFDPVSRKSTWYTNKPADIRSLPDDYVQNICLDKQGGVWLGTYLLGISNFYPNAPRFDPWPYNTKGINDVGYADSFVGASKQGTLFLIEKDQKKLQLFDSLGRRTTSFDLQFQPSSHYYRFYLDDDMLWAVKNSMLTSYNLKTRAYRDYPMAVRGQKELEADEVFNMLEDSKGRFWMIGGFGAILFNKQTGQFVKYRSVTYALSILEDSRHNIWIGGSDEVFLLRRDGTDFDELFTDKSTSAGNFASVWRMAEDRRGRVWAITRQGLQRFDQRSGRFQIDPKVQLSKIQDIQIDRSGYIWLANDTELIRYHPDRGTLQIYGYQDGLPFNGITRPASSIQGPSGRLYFMANKGNFQFSPDQIKAHSDSSRIVFTGLKLSDREIKVGDDTGLLTRNLDQITKLILRHDQNIFSVSFALLSFSRSERNRYAYKLEGFRDSWTYSDSPSATYMNLPSGDYILNVRAANGDGFWNTEPLRLKITVLPPWWRTWYAYLCYVLIFTAAVYAITRFFWLRSSFRRENALNQVKLDFFTNISHEIRTHLSLISGPLEKAFQQSVDNTGARNYLSYARNNSDRLMLLVNELLDFRKIQSGGVRLRVQEHDVVKIIKSVLAAFEHTANEKDIQTQLICPDTPIMLWLDIAQMQKVFYNLLSNAYKFAPEGGKVGVHIAQTSNEVIMTVEDNGKGIPEAHLRKLFTYYYQADSEKPGYGIGLALSKSIVEQHYGQLTAESRLATELSTGGTALTIRMLRDSRHFSPDQITLNSSDRVETMFAETIVMPAYDSDAPVKQNNTILIIEDNDQLRTFIKELFQGEFNTLEAENGQQGLDLAQEHIPDIILSDVMMPAMNGLELSTRLKGNLSTAHIPLVLLTARTQNEQVIEGLAAGADDYLVKPFDPRILQLKIGNLIRLRNELKDRYRQSVLADRSVGGGVARDRNEAFIDKLRLLVIESISDQHFGVNELATQIGMSVSALYRKMKSLTGMTINDFMKTIRLSEAQKLLESGVYTVGEVATIVGFEDSRHFSKEFKKVFGRNPSEIKKQILD